MSNARFKNALASMNAATVELKDTFGKNITPKRSRDDEAAPFDQPAKILRGAGPSNANVSSASVARSTDKFWIYLSKISPDVSEADVEKLAKDCLNVDEATVKSLIPRGKQVSTMSFISFKHLEATSVREVSPTVVSILPHSATTSFPLTVYYQNVRGLRTKTSTLLNSLLSCDFDVIVFTETWLYSDISNSELSSNYTIYRCDRNTRTSVFQRGGGVLIAVRAQLNSKAVFLEGSDDLEQVIVKVMLPHESICLCCIYIRPRSPADIYAKHGESLVRLLELADPRDTMIVMGDYNLPNLAWEFDDEVHGFLPLNASSEQELAVVESLLPTGLQQINDLVNANGRLLDLVFVSDSDRIELFESPAAILKVDPYHKPFVLTLECSSEDLQLPQSNSAARNEYNFARCDFDVINARLAALDWTCLSNLETVDDAVTVFYDNVYQVIRDNVPLKTRRKSTKCQQPWWNPQLRRLRNRLRKARKRYFRSWTTENKYAVQLAEAEYNSVHEVRFREYIEQMQRNLKKNPSSFWSFVNTRKRSAGIPNNVFYGNHNSSADNTSANLFAEFFHSVFESDYHSPPQQYLDELQSFNIHLPQLNLSIETVFDALNAVDVSKGPGPDQIPPSFIKTVQPRWLSQP
ncbi:uncharacterized protein LOC134221658 [Armigeres subalbatus]|uniref:uncharacterized protein LOC134221658 n=1 Tax=Armigeres subalbatus TaxID=124917 RepID=UPI002ED61CCF